MIRIFSVGAMLLFAMSVAALAQSSGPIGSIGGGESFSGDVMNNGGFASGVDVRVTAGSASRLATMEDPYAARDGCINYPGQAHNSADCSRIITWDPNWVLPDKPLSEMTGAEENMIRSYNILHPNHPAPVPTH
jgi:hypothetical protein